MLTELSLTLNAKPSKFGQQEYLWFDSVLLVWSPTFLKAFLLSGNNEMSQTHFSVFCFTAQGVDLSSLPEMAEDSRER